MSIILLSGKVSRVTEPAAEVDKALSSLAAHCQLVCVLTLRCIWFPAGQQPVLREHELQQCGHPGQQMMADTGVSAEH